MEVVNKFGQTNNVDVALEQRAMVRLVNGLVDDTVDCSKGCERVSVEQVTT